MRAEVIRLACERPADSQVPLARWSSSELAAEVISRGICEQISGVTVWRWLSEDAIKPWQFRSWIFPRDPQFTAKAGRILDLYAGRWEGQLLHPGDYVVCCDEKPSIQARHRKHQTLPAAPDIERGQLYRPSPRAAAVARLRLPAGATGARRTDRARPSSSVPGPRPSRCCSPSEQPSRGTPGARPRQQRARGRAGRSQSLKAQV